MRTGRRFVLIAVAVIVVAAIGVGVWSVWSKKQDGKYFYLSGTVTAYDVTPSYADGNIIFKIDGTSVDIGGGLRAGGDQPDGYVYSPIKIGDKVTAKVIQPESGYYTVFGCSSCYVKEKLF